MDEEQFYKSNNLEKYPDGRVNECKKCFTRHVDNFDPATYVPLMKECDVPHIPGEWFSLLEKYGKNKSKLTGLTIFGRYLSKMQLKQHREQRWADTELIQELENMKIEGAMKAQGYSAAEIAVAIAKGPQLIPGEEASLPPPADLPAESFSIDDETIPNDLTEEDQRYLRLKWGKMYKPEEWVKLEQMYEEMMQSYDIQSAGHIDTLKLVCKTSLKANQLLDLGDVDGAQKMVKMYDGLMKSGKFTAAQNKDAQGDFVDSIGELVAMCEKQGYIEKYYIDKPKDKVDETINDMKRYTHSLISGESDLITMIENAIKQNMREDEAALAADEEDILLS